MNFKWPKNLKFHNTNVILLSSDQRIAGNENACTHNFTHLASSLMRFITKRNVNVS